MGIDSYKAAAIQFEPRLFDKEKNCLELIELIKEAAESGAKLITTPEMAISGYCFFNEEEAARMAEPVSGKTVSLFKNLSSSLNIYLVLGMPEQDEESGLLYNSAIFIGPKGVLGVHRKTHSYISEPKWAAPGNNGHKVYDTPLGKIAILICMDIHFLETARVVAVEGADIICHISNWLAEKTPAPYWISRAYENNCYLLESNRWGLERGVQFSGGSCIISPNGDIISQIDTENGIVYANIDLNESRKMKKNVYSTLECRRPNLYRELQKNTFLWNPLDYFNLYNNNPISKGGSGKVSVVQDNFSENKNDNIKKILILIENIYKNDKSNLIIFPELCISGNITSNFISDKLDDLSDLIYICAKLCIWIVIGSYEYDGGEIFNSLYLIGPDGIVGKQKKIHKSKNDINIKYGNEINCFDIPLGRIGLVHGDDILFPEIGRILSLRGCDIIAVSANIKIITHSHDGTKIHHNYPIPTGKDLLHWHHIRVRAGENNLYIAFSNNSLFGKSGIFGPETFSFPRDEVISNNGNNYITKKIIIDNNKIENYSSTRVKDLVSMRLVHHYYNLSTKNND